MDLTKQALKRQNLKGSQTQASTRRTQVHKRTDAENKHDQRPHVRPSGMRRTSSALSRELAMLSIHSV